MKRYVVVFEESAQIDVRGSYDWGCRNWGKKEARSWVRQLRDAVSKQLSLMPRGFPIAPEDDEFSEEIRQMIVGRYRGCLPLESAKFMCSTLEEHIEIDYHLSSRVPLFEITNRIGSFTQAVTPVDNGCYFPLHDERADGSQILLV